MQVYAGSVDQYYGGTYYDIHVLIVHENYTTKRIKNDIGLIRLIEPMRIGTNMEIINFLPSDLYVYPGYKVTAVGWGLLYVSLLQLIRRMIILFMILSKITFLISLLVLQTESKQLYHS